MNNNKETIDQPIKESVEKKPNENVGFYFSSGIKISDPETGKVLVQKRCD
jgi:hypothetical protein